MLGGLPISSTIPKEVHIMSIIELDSKVAELRELQSMISELQAEAEAMLTVP